MEATVRVIARVGYTRTTLESIGTGAGYSRGLVQHRYGSKGPMLEELVNKIVTDQQETVLERLQSLHCMDALFCEIDCYLEGMDAPLERSRAFYMLMQESLGPAPHIRSAFAAIGARWHRALARQIEVGQQAGQIRPDVDPACEARLLIATLRGLRMQSMLDPHTSNIAKSIDSLKDGLRARLLQTR
ncbi:TetR/AcrR family transcriptional regulator [Burkholderia lata]|uniref:HTH-type transcriptional regulator BetI n=1 Tax=Burkholderia lata (strain ATCC 17760 / DSM 23089 / LMG 22485 / NCIMB 9086 / R18194 / 383) TaxID=482957 RepID=A0A6P2RAP8_BURL3|nr:TetR/AcrR family transcriptional regulator [Burkholderia lata]VWC32234.1 HTH-type transcriptional regulator BetI [Burkholderia lata]